MLPGFSNPPSESPAESPELRL